MRSLGRALAAALLGAFGGAIGLALVYGRSPALDVDFDVTPPRGIIDGIYRVIALALLGWTVVIALRSWWDTLGG